MKLRPLVSVVMITYNHEKFISEAIEGILNQEGDFDLELIIADDASSDGTSMVVENVMKSNPKGYLIKFFKHEKNIGILNNFVFVLKSAKGKYIAYCEGDDLWETTNKIEKQIIELESNKEYVLSFHDTFIINEYGEKIYESTLSQEGQRDRTENELISGYHFQTLSVIFRNNLFDYKILLKARDITNLDTLLFSILGLYGSGKFISSIKNTFYRIHSNGIWSSINTFQKTLREFETFKYLERFHNGAHKKIINIKTTSIATKILLNSVKEKNVPIFLKFYFISLFRNIKLLRIGEILRIHKGIIYNILDINSQKNR